MRAVRATGGGGPGSLAIVEIPEPLPGPGEVLLRVVATAVNRADLMQRDGHYPPPPGVTDVLGLEASGEVVRVGAGVRDVDVGDRRMALLAGGGYAEYACVPAGHLLPIPDAFTWEQAAATPEVFLTAYLTLVRLAALRPGERALIHSGASGVGLAAVQIANAVGARALATSRDARRLARATEFGGVPIVVSDGKFADAVMTATDGHGADVILDLVGAAYWPDNAACLARGGRIVLTGLVAGRRAQVDLGGLLAKNAAVIGSTLRGRTVDEKDAIVADFTKWGLPLLADGTLRPCVDSVMPLADVAQAHERLGADRAVGKIVLRIG